MDGAACSRAIGNDAPVRLRDGVIRATGTRVMLARGRVGETGTPVGETDTRLALVGVRIRGNGRPRPTLSCQFTTFLRQSTQARHPLRLIRPAHDTGALVRVSIADGVPALGHGRGREDASKAMKISNLSRGIRRAVAALVSALLLATTPRAYAYGEPRAPVPPSAEKILLVDNRDSTTTAILQIDYAGPSRTFTWVIPVPGKPKVGVSSNAVFRRLDAATSPQYWVEVTVEGTCIRHDPPDAAVTGSTGVAPSASEPPAAAVADEAWVPAGRAKREPAAGAVQVIDRGSIGPYEFVNIEVDKALREGANVASDWLAASGYDLSGFDREALGASLRDGLHLLAFKLADDADVGAIRPVVVTYESKRPVVAIRPTTVPARGLRVWVIGPSQAVPVHSRSLVINDAMLDWSTCRKYVAGTLPAGGVGPFDPYDASKPSNYDAVVAAAADEAGGQGFVTELGAPASRYRSEVWSSLDDQRYATLSHQRYADGIDAILAASSYYRDWDGWKDAVEGATTLPAGVTIDAFGRNPDPYRGVARVDTPKFFQLLAEGVIRPVADAAAMLRQGPYLTRLYGATSSGEMTVDPTFDYNPDLALVSDIHIARQHIECRPTLERYDALWRFLLPQGEMIAGKGTGGWPHLAGSMPANLEIVQLSTAGSGTVVEDNRNAIGMKLFRAAATTADDLAAPRPPQHGLMIGGVQTVTPHGPSGSPQSVSRPLAGNACSVSRVGADANSALALWLPQAAGILALRRRRTRRAAAGRRRSRKEES